MKTYSVDIKVTGKYEIILDAEDRSQAMELALKTVHENVFFNQVLDEVEQEVVLIHSICQSSI